MWNGAFSPNVRKHRDYQHETFFEHELANGGTYEIGPRVWLTRDPISGNPIELSPWRMIIFTTHDGSEYIYLVPEGSGTEPSEEEIKESIDEYSKNPVDGGRDINDYIDFDKTDTETGRDWLENVGHSQPRSSDWYA